ncbi:hypothetical protein HPB47_021017 [Ixodes persulcatus]|uniref:Uncharacterized protein n=1 Tax=Ixodes persulcatus TaxID=34615 RepID=A0AC60QDR3_IXOPE|nr:hypothetical protein HPB47_021017 [Ixodes persulcatus]
MEDEDLRVVKEAHRALELLEEYHSRLNKPQDKQLRNAIERVIRIFKSRLFQALLDIQEFYEITLLDDSKSIQQKTAETLQIACKWENSPPITGTHANSSNEVSPSCRFALAEAPSLESSSARTITHAFSYLETASPKLGLGAPGFCHVAIPHFTL